VTHWRHGRARSAAPLGGDEAREATQKIMHVHLGVREKKRVLGQRKPALYTTTTALLRVEINF